MTTALEQSFADICAAHALTVFQVSYRPANEDRAAYWSVNAHWEGYTASGHNCTSQHGETIAEALSNCLTAVTAFRTIPLADEALPEIAA